MPGSTAGDETSRHSCRLPRQCCLRRMLDGTLAKPTSGSPFPSLQCAIAPSISFGDSGSCSHRGRNKEWSAAFFDSSLDWKREASGFHRTFSDSFIQASRVTMSMCSCAKRGAAAPRRALIPRPLLPLRRREGVTPLRCRVVEVTPLPAMTREWEGGPEVRASAAAHCLPVTL
jgi:hypothetical protein